MNSRVIILAAGKGERLGGATADLPKVLLEVGGKALLSHQLDSLASCDVPQNEITVLSGYKHDRLEEHLSAYPDVRIQFNPHFEDRNNCYSLQLALENCADGSENIYVLNGDFFGAKSIYQKFLGTNQSSCVMVDPANADRMRL